MPSQYREDCRFRMFHFGMCRRNRKKSHRRVMCPAPRTDLVLWGPGTRPCTFDRSDSGTRFEDSSMLPIVGIARIQKCTAPTHKPAHWNHSSAHSAHRYLGGRQTSSPYTSPPCRKTGLGLLDRPVSPVRTDIALCNTASCQGHTRHYRGICKCRGRNTSSWSLCLDRSPLHFPQCHFHTSGA